MDKKIKNTHNGIISFWKFMFCIMLVFFHITDKNPNKSTLMLYGQIGVDFFFLVSGYLMAKTALSKKENTENLGKETFHYIWKKIKTFFPYALCGFFMYFFVRSLYTDYTINERINSIWNLLFLDMSGIRYTIINFTTWYISSMLISMWILYPLIRKYRKNYIYIIAPLIVYFLGGWIAHEYGNLTGPDLWTGITYKGTLKALFEIAFGTIIYEIANNLKKVNFTFLARLILTIIETIGFISIFFIVNLSNASNRYGFIMLLILFVSVTLAFSEKNIFYNLANNKLVYYLEKLSLPIYLNQNWIIMLISKSVPKANIKIQSIAILTYVIIFSMLLNLIIDKIKGLDKRNLKSIFIKETNERNTRRD